MTETHISPFNFLCWKEDDGSLIASTLDRPDYISILTIDGIDAEDIISYARETGGENWANCVAEKFPDFVSTLARKEPGRQCFVDTGKAMVEFADARTWEVQEKEFEATATAYNEAVRIELMRRDNDDGKKKKKTDNHSEDDDDDDYETVDSDDADDDDEEDSEANTARHIVAMVGSQLESAIYLADKLGLTKSEIKNVFSSCVKSEIPSTLAECTRNTKNEAVLMYIMSMQEHS